MADFIHKNELERIMEDLKKIITSSHSDAKLIKFYTTMIDGFIQFCNEEKNGSINNETAVSHYYERTTRTEPYTHPGTPYLRKKARAVLLIRDSLRGTGIRKLYRYNTFEIPKVYQNDVANYSAWMSEKNNSTETIRTRIGRLKMFLIELEKAGCFSLKTLTIELFMDYISVLERGYTSAGKSNILYTLRNYFTCPCISEQLTFDLIPLLTNIHTNKHERLRSFYTPEEIQKVLNTVNRNTYAGKMLYLMMLLACVYGLRAYDIKILRISSVDWKNNLIKLSQHKTKRHLDLPLTDEVKFALLDYLKNARPKVADDHVFIKICFPHEPYSNDSRFSGKVKHYFTLAGINTDRKHAGFHAMRHSLASSLMSDATPISEIANILGHTSVQSTKQYIWSDISQLRTAALEVPSYDK